MCKATSFRLYYIRCVTLIFVVSEKRLTVKERILPDVDTRVANPGHGCWQQDIHVSEVDCRILLGKDSIILRDIRLSDVVFPVTFPLFWQFTHLLGSFSLGLRFNPHSHTGSDSTYLTICISIVNMFIPANLIYSTLLQYLLPYIIH